MTEVENHIYTIDPPQRDIILFFHQMLTQEYALTAKITFGNPCYYRKSWICYLRPIDADKVELAFLRGNELSNEQGILESKGRKQLRSIEFSKINKIRKQAVKEMLQEAILLDEIKPYESKRKSRK